MWAEPEDHGAASQGPPVTWLVENARKRILPKSPTEGPALPTPRFILTYFGRLPPRTEREGICVIL